MHIFISVDACLVSGLRPLNNLAGVLLLTHGYKTYIFAGNLGGSHSPVNDVYISSDGGVEWAQVLEGQFNYQIADHGGIIVAAPKEPTTFVM